MNTELLIQNQPVKTRLQEIFKNQRNNSETNEFLRLISGNINWDEVLDKIIEGLDKETLEQFDDHDVFTITKCIILSDILGISDFVLPFQISENDSYKEFTGLNSFSEIPKVKVLGSFRNCLIEKRIYNEILDAFYLQLTKPGINILEYELQNKYSDSGDTVPEEKFQESEDKIREIEEKIKTLYDRKIPSHLVGLSEEKADALSTKMVEVNLQIMKLMNGNLSSESLEFQYLLNVEKSIDRIYNLVTGLEGKEIENDKEEITDKGSRSKLHIQLFDTFFESIEEKNKEKNENPEFENPESDNETENKLKYADKILEELIKSSNNLNIISSYQTNQKEDENYSVSPNEETDTNESFELRNHQAISLNPKAKKEGIFNDENLTEDYELGFRFYQLGLKTGFFNVKLDSHNESTRIATAEFFPNKFWPSVKQRSRWIAGICLQNWKANKWFGNLSTRYFLFRDRKPLFSLPGAFFSNIIFLYLVYSVGCELFNFESPVPLVNEGSALWYMMVSILVFMASRVTHRFIFTFNWYGFRFAASSLARSLLDTFINFFAVLRALKVFKQTKKKVVWDATTHY